METTPHIIKFSLPTGSRCRVRLRVSHPSPASLNWENNSIPSLGMPLTESRGCSTWAPRWTPSPTPPTVSACSPPHRPWLPAPRRRRDRWSWTSWRNWMMISSQGKRGRVREVQLVTDFTTSVRSALMKRCQWWGSPSSCSTGWPPPAPWRSPRLVPPAPCSPSSALPATSP